MELTPALKISDIDFNKSTPQYEINSVIRHIIPKIDQVNYWKIWIEIDYANFFDIMIRTGDKIDLKLQGKKCKMCRKLVDLIDIGYCRSCFDPNSEFALRLKCIFDDPNSPLNIMGDCNPKSPPCGFVENVKYCHSTYILYITRIGNLIKAGVSRTSRKGSYNQRLIEQGSQEAIIISPFPNLIKAQKAEKDLIDIGLLSRIKTSDKLQDLQFEKNLELLQIYPLELIEDYFPDYDIIYKKYYEDANFQNISIINESLIKGRIEQILGNLLIVRLEDQRFGLISSKHLINRLIRELAINGEQVI